MADAPTIRSDALVGIPISTLSDISFLLGTLEVLMKPSGPTPRVMDEVNEVLIEAIERGEVVSVSGDYAAGDSDSTRSDLGDP